MKIKKTSAKIPAKNAFNFLNIKKAQIKSILNTVFGYHILSRKILFAGFPFFQIKKLKKLKKKQEHYFIHPSTWVNGLLTNFYASFYTQLKKKKVFFKTDFKRKTHLIVNLNKTEENKTIAQESEIIKLPVIFLNAKETNKKDNNKLFNMEHLFFFLTLKAILKKKRLKIPKKIEYKKPYKKSWYNKKNRYNKKK